MEIQIQKIGRIIAAFGFYAAVYTILAIFRPDVLSFVNLRSIAVYLLLIPEFSGIILIEILLRKSWIRATTIKRGKLLVIEYCGCGKFYCSETNQRFQFGLFGVEETTTQNK